MFYYSYDDRSNLIAKFNSPPTDGTPVWQYTDDLDLQNYDYVVGQIKDGVITWLNPAKPKPVPVLIQHIQDLRAENDVLGQTAAQVALDNMQLNSMVDTLGAALAQAQLDIISLKGGVA